MKPKNIIFTKSNRKNKKYRVDFDYGGKHHTIHFGDINYEQYKDSTGLGLYSYLNHNDKNRRNAYRKRAGNIRDKNGKLTVSNPLSSNYWAYRYLW